MEPINLCDDCYFDPEACEACRFCDSEGNVYDCQGFCDSEGEDCGGVND